ncbi:MAG: GntR family transcriptional regulator [Micrococcales bacterium]
MASMELDSRSGVPLYRQIMNILRSEIKAGQFDAQEPITEAKLIARFDVSLAPIRQALKELTNEGLVYRKQGKGTFPMAEVKVDRPADLKPGDLYRYLADKGLHPTSKVSGLERTAPPENVRAKLGLPEGEKVLHFSRQIAVDEQPFAINDIYIVSPKSFLPTVRELNGGGSALALLEERHGIVLDHAEHEAWASAATKEQAKLLGVEPGSPVLVIDTLFFAKDGSAAGWRSALHHPNEFKYHFITGA